MTATTNTRVDAKRWLVDRLDNLLGPNVVVSYGEPRGLTRSHVWVGDADGTIEYRALMAGRKQRKDEFSVAVWCSSSEAGDDAETAEQRVNDMCAALENLLADAPTCPGLAGTKWAGITDVRGPMSDPVDAGYSALIRVTVEFHTELS